MNDHHSHRRRSGAPEWPTGDDPDSSAKRDVPQERTGFWSPLWEDDDRAPARGRSNGSNGNHHQRSNGTNGSNGHATHRLPDGDARGAHHATPPPRTARPSSNPAWPTEEPQPGPRGAAAHQNGARSHTGATTRVVRPRPAGPPRPGGRPGPGGPGGIPDGPTENLPQVHGRTGPEPELLTHRELDYDDGQGYEEDFEPQPIGAGPDLPLTDNQRRRRRRKTWRRVRRTAYVMTALMIIIPMVGFFVAYQIVKVPNPQSFLKNTQTVTLWYNNKSVMGKVVPADGENRQQVKYKDIPKDVLHAVFAAEDATFMTNRGFDITGVMRAAWNQATGGGGGGSTISQQYIKKATGNEQKTVVRKALEVVEAYKMNNSFSKEDIITAYLNIVYFGRGAYGIAAAAKAYYNKGLKELTAPQAALLAGMIQNPSRYRDTAYMNKRWNYVMDQMVAHNWYPADKRRTEKFPQTIPIDEARPHAMTGASAHIRDAVIKELKDRANISEDELYRGGFVIKTTIDPRAQKLAAQSVHDVLQGEPKNIRPAVVAVNPKDGGVLAYYGGDNGAGLDWAATPQEPGSSFKPFDLVALLKKGEGLSKEYDGSDRRMFEGRTTPVRNSDGASCGKQCTVAEAMKRSINTVFYDMAVNTVQTKNVLIAAREAGITSDLNGPKKDDTENPDGNIAIGGGDTRVSTFEMASAYATFAADGIYRKPHLVSQVLRPDGRLVYQAPEEEKQAFDQNSDKNHQIARNVTESLKPVIEYSRMHCTDDRPCAGKTGTHQLGTTADNAKAWMVGYTPTLSAAVSMSAENPKGKQMPLRTADGRIVYGSGLPGHVWQEFMDRYLAGTPEEDFGHFEPIGPDFRDQPETQTSTTESSTEESKKHGPGNRTDNPGPPTTTTDQQPSGPPTNTSFPQPSFPLGRNPGQGGG